jgi:hypothetical protein
LGLYVLQLTTTANPSADTPEDAWTTVATFDYTENRDADIGGQFTSFLRHEYQIMHLDGTAVTATGIRLLVPDAGLGGGTAIDELEVYAAMPPALEPAIASDADAVTLSWQGQPGARYFVEYSETLEAGSWQILPGADTIDASPNGVTSVIDPVANRQRYYRVGTR